MWVKRFLKLDRKRNAWSVSLMWTNRKWMNGWNMNLKDPTQRFRKSRISECANWERWNLHFTCYNPQLYHLHVFIVSIWDLLQWSTWLHFNISRISDFLTWEFYGVSKLHFNISRISDLLNWEGVKIYRPSEATFVKSLQQVWNNAFMTAQGSNVQRSLSARISRANLRACFQKKRSTAKPICLACQKQGGRPPLILCLDWHTKFQKRLWKAAKKISSTDQEQVAFRTRAERCRSAYGPLTMTNRADGCAEGWGRKWWLECTSWLIVRSVLNG